ncbi:ATP-utilizing chromatin assembly and remodelling N-terminal-domain-containing protein [Dichotomocladium elegans]|nr:ATP-utilizing chromatin assembly and remodelling N-terminal-domain-containing protein [Dichotomocladium elegans]
MPLLKRKPFPLLDPPPCDLERKESRDRQVWVSAITGEIFMEYTAYLERTLLYRQPIWQCEMTGRINLTYAEALESERVEKSRVKEKLPEELQRRVLERAQFKTIRLDAVVDDIYDYYIDRFDEGDLVTCRWNDGVKYNARVLQYVPENETGKSSNKRLNKALSAAVLEQVPPPRFLVELVDDDLTGLPEYIQIVTKSDLKRDRLQFSKNLLKKFLRESMTKESYIGAPWVVKRAVADKYKLDTTLPADLQKIKEQVDAKSGKRRSQHMAATKAAQEKKEVDARKLEAALKYPIEDLDVPTYRRDPSGDGPIIDMSPGQPGSNTLPLNPTGGLPKYPETSPETIPDACFGSVLMVYSFLSVFAKPLNLYPFSLDDFENALRHSSVDIKSHILIESNVSLVNAIINERRKPRANNQAASSEFGSYVSLSRSTPTPNLSRQGSSHLSEDEDMDVDNDNEMEKKESPSSRAHVCWGRPEIDEISDGWDIRPIPAKNDREGWVDVLIGCVHDIAPPEKGADIDRIFAHLVPHTRTNMEEREIAYLRLSLRDKIVLMDMLVNVVNECTFIKDYMEESQEQLTELRKQKIDLSRERKRIHSERQELERRSEESLSADNGTDASAVDYEGDEENIERPVDSNGATTRTESRQAVLKRKQIEREEREAKKAKLYHRQREQARARNQEMKARNAMRKRLDEEERQLYKKEEQVEHNMRKYSTLRIKPLGRDRFYNRYFYMDNIGGANAHGTARLFVQSPSQIDLIMLRERDDPATIVPYEDPARQACGRGGGLAFVCELMRAQGLENEAEFLERHTKDAEAAKTLNHPGWGEWWKSFQHQEEVENLLAWLSPKGIREHRLRKEIEKHLHSLMMGMKKRASDQLARKDQTPTRSTRSKAVPTPLPGTWLAYVNKYQK